MQFGWVGPKQAEQVPEKEKAGSESEKKLIGHLGSQSGSVVHRRLPNHPARGASNQPQHLHRTQVYFALRNYPLNSPRPVSIVKKILILTAGFGEGHNSAARGIRDALGQVVPDATVECRDLFAEVFGRVNEVARRAYLVGINRAPHVWSAIYSWIDQRRDFRHGLRWFSRFRRRLSTIIERDPPEVIVSVYPPYPHFLDELYGPAKGSKPRRVVCVTDSITINSIWYRCSVDYFLLANEQTADVLARAGIDRALIRVFGFPVSPRFAALAGQKIRPSGPPWRILQMINAGQGSAPALARWLARIPNTELTVTVGRDENLRRAVESIRDASAQKFTIIGWTTELPQLLASHHVLVSKAGGATVQEAIAAACPIIINQVVPGQEEGNAQLITQSNSGTVALNNDEVIATLTRAFADDAKLLQEWSENIAKISRPAASLEIAKFLLEL
jgi:processive 1,2-diacylglycerol beta-glucosyltransferase